MAAWRDDILAQALKYKLLNKQEAEEIRRRDLNDEDFIRAVTGRFPASSWVPENSHHTSEQTTSASKRGELLDAREDGGPKVKPEEYGLPSFIDQKYELLYLIGEGGMGSVWKANDRELERTVAVKFARSTSVTPVDIEQIRREGKTLAKLNDPNLVSILDAGSLPTGQPYFVMTFIEAVDVKTYIMRIGESRRWILRLMADVAHAIARAHTSGIIHRDLKPSHVLVKSDGTPVVIDFGLAKVISPMSDDTRVLRGDSADEADFNSRPFGGTAGYRAPEQLRDGPITASCDVYALGVLLTGLLTNSKHDHASASSDPSTARAERSSETTPIESLPYELKAILDRCLRRNPDERYSYAGELASELEAYLAGNPVNAITKNRLVYKAKKHFFRHRYVVVPTLIVFLTALSFWAYHTWQLGIATNRAVEAQGRAERGEQRASVARDRAEAIALKQSLEAANSHLRLGMYEEARQAIVNAPKTRWGWECDRILLESHIAARPVRIVGVHDWAASALLVSSDGQSILSAGQDGRVVCWNRDERIQGRDLFGGQWNALLGLWQHSMAVPQGLDLPP